MSSTASLEESSAIDRYLADLLQGQEVVAERIRATIKRETPLYACFDDPVKEAEWAAGIDAALAMFVSGVTEDRGVRADERAAMAAIGRARADQDEMTLDAIDASIRVAVGVALDFVMEGVDGMDEEHRLALRELSSRLTRFGNEIAAAMLTAFLARKEERATSRLQADVRLYDDVLGGRFDVAEVVGRAASQGIDLSAAQAMVLVTSGHDGGEAHDAESDMVGALSGAVAVPMATAPVPHAVVVFPMETAARWSAVLHRCAEVAARHGCTFVVVGPCRGPHELHSRYRSARSLLPYVPRLAADAPVLDAAELAELTLLTGVEPDARRAYLEDLLGPIERAPRSSRLFRTLEAVTHHGTSLKAVAQHTAFNVKTVRNHIREIERLTGLCLDRPPHLQRLAIGVQLRRLVVGDRFSA